MTARMADHIKTNANGNIIRAQAYTSTATSPIRSAVSIMVKDAGALPGSGAPIELSPCQRLLLKIRRVGREGNQDLDSGLNLDSLLEPGMEPCGSSCVTMACLSPCSASS